MKKKTHTPYWFNVVRKAITRKNKGKVPFTMEHIEKSGSWVTCACGKQDPRIPRNKPDYGVALGEPKDTFLAISGFEFSVCVRNQNPVRALLFLLSIEKRSADILAAL